MVKVLDARADEARGRRCNSHGLMYSIACIGLTIVLATPWSASALSQQPDTGNANDVQQEDAQASQQSSEMTEMARAMKSMANMCQTMMEQEMKHRPYIIAAGAVAGTLLAIALILFIVLEIQWIRLLSVRIRNEKK